MGFPTTTALLAAPSAAAGVSITPNASAWANSSWVQLIASTGGKSQLAGLSIQVSTQDEEAEYELGTGGAGSETPIAVVRITNGATVNWAGIGVWLFPVPIDNVATATRVAVRCRVGSASAAARTVALLYYQGCDSTSLFTGATKTLPAAANGITITPNGTAWANSAWVQMTAGIGNEIAIAGLALRNFALVSGNQEQAEVDIGTGGSGSEVVVTTLRLCQGNTKSAMPNCINLPAIFPIAASTRIAVRLRKGNTNTALTIPVGLTYYDNTSLLAHNYTQAVSGTLSFAGAEHNQTAALLTGSLSFSGSLSRFISAALAGTLSFVGTFPSRISALVLTAGLSFVGAVTKQTSRLHSGALSFSGVMGRQFGLLLTAALSFAGAITKQTGALMTATLSFVGSMGRLFQLLLTAGLSFSGAIKKRAGVALAGVLSFVGKLSNIPPPKVTQTRLIRRMRRTPHLDALHRRTTFAALELLAQTGTGATLGPGVNPQVMLRWSDDGGRTWSNLHTTTLGALGRYLTRVRWVQLGQARDRVFEVVVSDPVVAVLVGAYLDANVGAN